MELSYQLLVLCAYPQTLVELSYQLLVHCTCLQTLVESDFIVLARILYPGSQIEETFSQYLQFKTGDRENVMTFDWPE